jgi:type I restriction enzyme, S subunit
MNKTLGQKEFGELEVVIPRNVKEQKKIVEILLLWDKAIDLKEKLIEKKKEQRKGLMQKLLTGEVRLPGFNDEWNEERLEELCEKMKSGGTPKADNKSFYGGNIPFVKVNDMTTSGKYLFDTEQSITEEGLNSSSTWIVPKNNLLYSMYASVGFVSINKVEVATNQAIMAVVPNKKIELEFLYYSLVNYQQKLYRFIEKGTQGNLNAKLVKSIPISFPSIPEQKAITEILATSDREIHLLVKGLENLKEQKKGLMQLLLTGKVRVKG